jgi:drug/metabolite transporter (DMT)-like permease
LGKESVIGLSQRHLGILQSVLSGLCFGSLGLFGKNLYTYGVRPGELLSLRFLLASTVLIGFLLFRGRPRLKLPLASLASCALLGIAGYALFSFCFFTALTGLSSSLTVILLFTYPIGVTVGGRLLFGDRIPAAKRLALPLGLLGMVALVWGEMSVRSPTALVYGMAAALFYALYILYSARFLRRIHPLVSTAYIQLFAGLTLTCLFLRSPIRAWTILSQDPFSILMIALVGTVFAMSLFLAGLQKLKSWEVSLLSITEPLSTVVLASIFLGERMSLLQWGGTFTVLASMVWIALPAKR